MTETQAVPQKWVKPESSSAQVFISIAKINLVGRFLKWESRRMTKMWVGRSGSSHQIKSGKEAVCYGSQPATHMSRRQSPQTCKSQLRVKREFSSPHTPWLPPISIKHTSIVMVCRGLTTAVPAMLSQGFLVPPRGSLCPLLSLHSSWTVISLQRELPFVLRLQKTCEWRRRQQE